MRHGKAFLFLAWLMIPAAVVAQQPTLRVSEISANEIRIAWPASAVGFVLEVTSALGTGANWTLVPVTPVEAGGELSVAINPTENRRFFRLRQANPPLTIIRETSPAQGEPSVAVNRETVIYLSGPLSTNTLIGNNDLYAQFGDRRMLSRVHISTDRRTVTLFYLEPLPSSARVRVTFKGANLTDAMGRLVDVDGDGAPGGTFTLDFDTLSLAPVAQTSVSGRIFASQLKASGNDEFLNVPLAGVTVTVDGMEETMRAVTDAMGNFRLEPVPAGDFFVHIDGRTVTNLAEGIRWPDMAYYPNVNKKWTALAGGDNSPGEIYLPLIPAGTLKPVSPDQPTVLMFDASFIANNPQFDGVMIMVPPNALYSENGLRGGMVGIAPVQPDRLPGPLPEGLPIQDVITIQTDGAGNFDVPVPACFPNLPDPKTGEKLPPGAKSALWSFNHDTGRFEIVGSATVSADGRLVCTDPGVGILAPGWHGTAPGSTARGGDIGEGGGSRRRPGSTGPSEPAKDDCDADGTCKTDRVVLLHSGEERLERTDLFIPGRGEIHFELQRVYRSRLNYNGPVGQGWTYNYNEGLYIEENGDVTRFNGRARLSTWVRQPDGSFKAPAGDFRDLIQAPDGKYVLRSADGFQRFYRTDGRLYCIQDRYENRMLLDYDGRGNLKRVIDAYGREIEFTFNQFGDGVDRLVRVTDFIGREIVYSYDGLGDLVEVRGPVVSGTSTGNDFPAGRSERYAYSKGFANPELNHNILSITAPEEVAKGGPPFISWTYGTDPNDPVTFDRVLTETYGGTNASGIPAGGTTVFSYERLNANVPLGDPTIPRGRTTITMRNGNKMEYYANELNQHIMTRQLTRGFRTNEPAFYETRSFYDSDGQLMRRVFPEGNEVRYKYNTAGPRTQRQNVLEIRRVAGPRGGGEDIVTTFTYEPLYNQISTMTSPLGNAANYQPPLGTASAARYTTRYFYDYQESNTPVEQAIAFGIDLSQVPRGLGDLNGDGRTDQTFGNRVRVQAPTVQLRADSHEAALIGTTNQVMITETQWNDRGQLLATIDPEGNVRRMHYYPEDDPDGDGEKTFAPYVALTSEPTGYLERMVSDAENSPRRRAGSPAPLALETRMSYDPVGNLIAVRNPRGIVTAAEVNELNETVAVMRGADVSEAVRTGQLLGNESPKKYLTRYYYDFDGRTVRRETENRDSNTPGVGEFVDETFVYDLLGNLVQRTAEVDVGKSLTWEYRYDGEELPILMIKPEGNRDAISYDERNLRFKMTRGAGTDEAAIFQTDYDLNGNTIRVVDAEDNDGDGQPEATTYLYDGFDREVRMVDALGNETRRSYDVGDRVIRMQMWGHPPANPGGSKVLLSDTVYQYDEVSRLFETDEALFLSEGFNPVRPVVLRDENGDGWVTTRQEFDALSRRTATIEDDLQKTFVTYDGNNRLLETVDQVGNRRRMVYDRNSNPVMVQDIEVSPEKLVPDEVYSTAYVYDQLDRLVRATDNAGQTTRFTYDSRDNLVSRSDPEGPLTTDPLEIFPGQINGPGNTQTFVHDGFNRMVQMITDLRVGGVGMGALDMSNPHNPDGRITVSYVYDGNSRVRSIVDDNGRPTTFGYDALDRKISHTFADGKSYQYTFDRDGNMRRKVDPNGTVVTMSFDAINRMTELAAVRGSAVAGTTRETFAYDGLSRMVRATDDNGDANNNTQAVELTYDSLDRILEELQNGKAISSRYAGDGKRLGITYPGGRVIDRTFDSIDRIKSLQSAGKIITTSDWIGGGDRELLRMNGNGTTLSFLNDTGNQDTGYDAIKRIIGLRVMGPGGTRVLDREYAYNRASRRIAERRNDDFGLTDRYAYDSAYRIVSSEFDLDGLTGAIPRGRQRISYLLDGVGNRRQTEEANATLGIVTSAYGVNEVNEYSTVGGVGRFYDENGNLTDDGRRLFAYDCMNRLVSVRDKATGSPIAAYQYFTDGRRARKTVFSRSIPGTVEKVTSFLWDGAQEVEEQDAGSSATESTFVWSPVFVDELVEYQNNAGSFYTHQDARADVAAISNGSGQVVERIRYDDYGMPDIRGPSGEMRAESAVGNHHLFQGRRFDAETGLYYYRMRYYDPGAARFLQRDPVWDPRNDANQYTFVGNSPLSATDPFGLQSALESAVRGGIAAFFTPRTDRSKLPAGTEWDIFFDAFADLVKKKRDEGANASTLGNITVNLGIEKAGGKCNDWADWVYEAVKGKVPQGYEVNIIIRDNAFGVEAFGGHAAVALLDPQGNIIGVLDPHTGGGGEAGRANIISITPWMSGRTCIFSTGSREGLPATSGVNPPYRPPTPAPKPPPAAPPPTPDPRLSLENLTRMQAERDRRQRGETERATRHANTTRVQDTAGDEALRRQEHQERVRQFNERARQLGLPSHEEMQRERAERDKDKPIYGIQYHR